VTVVVVEHVERARGVDDGGPVAGAVRRQTGRSGDDAHSAAARIDADDGGPAVGGVHAVEQPVDRVDGEVV
jgi:hypothetical protein